MTNSTFRSSKLRPPFMIPWRIFLVVILGSTAISHPAETSSKVSNPAVPFAIPTFHCLSLYWSPPGGAAGRPVQVRYRAENSSEWHRGLDMRYNPIANTDEDLADYRGSIVHLAPGTTYEIQLTLYGTEEKASFKAATWNETFPAGEIIRVKDQSTALVITNSGTPQAWRVYDGRGATIDTQHKQDSCIIIDASYIIIRGLTLRGAGATNLQPQRTIGAIRINSGHDIVIEDCDISDWGRLNPATGFGFDYDAAIYSRSSSLKRLIVQRCNLHEPAFDGSTW